MLIPRFKLRFAVNVYVLALTLARAGVRVRGVRSNHMQPFTPFSKFFSDESRRYLTTFSNVLLLFLSLTQYTLSITKNVFTLRRNLY